MRCRNIVFLVLMCVLCACVPALRQGSLHDKEYLSAQSLKNSDPKLAHFAECGLVLQLDAAIKKDNNTVYGAPEFMKKYPIYEIQCKNLKKKIYFTKYYDTFAMAYIKEERGISVNKVITDYSNMLKAANKIIVNDMEYIRRTSKYKTDVFDYIFKIQRSCTYLYDYALQMCYKGERSASGKASSSSKKGRSPSAPPQAPLPEGDSPSIHELLGL